ncbi:hypothetical protein [Solibacillus sp. CAU 1738]|uniref:hypothetical protein n=1 Tax=Solibacillus sp. CAU 1738 TaxID=3140363 RepID=UPI0032619863
MEKLLTVLLTTLLLVGCTEKASTAEEHGKGISVEMAASQKIKHLSLVKYVDGIVVTSDNVINADNSPFKKGEIIWFDTSLGSDNSLVKIAISYSQNIDATEETTTEKIDISNATKWVNVRLNQDMEIEIVDLE